MAPQIRSTEILFDVPGMSKTRQRCQVYIQEMLGPKAQVEETGYFPDKFF